jgi:hypothetical protein
MMNLLWGLSHFFFIHHPKSLKWHHHHPLASDGPRGCSFWKHVCFLRTMIKMHVFAKRCLSGVTMCAQCTETLHISFVTHHWTSCLAGMNVCSREHLFLLVMMSSFKMDIRDGWLMIVNVMCIWIQESCHWRKLKPMMGLLARAPKHTMFSLLAFALIYFF